MMRRGEVKTEFGTEGMSKFTKSKYGSSKNKNTPIVHHLCKRL